VKTENRHQCLIYEGHPSSQLNALAATIIQRLQAGYRCLYLNNEAMVADIRACLSTLGIDVASEIASGRLVLSSETTLNEKGEFDIDLMIHGLEDALNRALDDGFAGLFATGDMTWEFGSEKNFSKLLTYEARLENLFQERKELSGICQYHVDTLPIDVPKQALLTHRSVFINETLTRINHSFMSDGSFDVNKAPDPRLEKTLSELRKFRKKK
jgi:hypothetical protein